jgi:hypothetical protein
MDAVRVSRAGAAFALTLRFEFEFGEAAKGTARFAPLADRITASIN